MRRRASGFTLLEVMVALAVVSIGLIAAFNGIIQMAHSTSMLRERAMADWIAMNMISTIRISGDFPDVGSFDGSTEFASREWRWEARVSETGVNDLRRIDMHVAYEDRPDDTVTIVTGFVARQAGGTAPVDWWGAGAPAADPPEGEADDDADAEAEAEAEGERAPRRPRREEQTEEEEE
jgi:general secretion pathway protein I